MLRMLVTTLAAMLLAGATTRAVEKTIVVVYDGVPTKVLASGEPSTDLWITMKDLKLATRFVVKPQGVCRDELCFPLPAKRKADFISKRGGAAWFNLAAFAALIKQTVARDEKNGVWYFGPWTQAHEGYLASLEAPEFSLPDLQGKMHSLADYRGKKVLLITWASW